MRVLLFAGKPMPAQDVPVGALCRRADKMHKYASENLFKLTIAKPASIWYNNNVRREGYEPNPEKKSKKVSRNA